VSDKVSHSYITTVKIIVLYAFIFKFCDLFRYERRKTLKQPKLDYLKSAPKKLSDEIESQSHTSGLTVCNYNCTWGLSWFRWRWW
jgi:hypothetical protein